MSRLLRFSGLLSACWMFGCAEQPKPAPPPDVPLRGAAAPVDGSPESSEKSVAAAANTTDMQTKKDAGDIKTSSAPKADSSAAASKPNAAAPKKPAGPTQVQFDLSRVTEDYIAALVLHPQRALSSPVIAGLKEEGVLTEADLVKSYEPILRQTGLNPPDIEEIAILIDKRVAQASARQMGLPVVGEAPAAPQGPLVDKNHLKQVGLGFHNYHDVYSFFPAATGSGDGENRNGFSWRVQMAPFVEGANVYNQIQFDQEWDSDDNTALHEQMPESFQSRGVTDAGQTAIHVITGEGTLFQDDVGTPIREITDGTSNTVLAVMAGADTAENWMKPGGLEFDPEHPTKCLGTLEDETFLVLMADGAVRSLSKEIDPANFGNLVTAQDNQVVQLDDAQQAPPPSTPFGMEGTTPETCPIYVLKMAAAVDHQMLLSQLPGSSESKTHSNQEYFVAEGWAMAFPTEQTAVFSGETSIKNWLASKGTAKESALGSQLRAADQPFDMLLTVDLSSQKELMQFLIQQNPMLGPFANLQSLSLTANGTGQTGDLLLAMQGQSTSPETAQTLAAIVNGLALNQLKATIAMQSNDPNLTEEQQELVQMFQPELAGLEMTSDGNRLTLQISIPEGFDRLPQLLAPQLKQAREQADRMQKQLHLRMIGLAFHNYHDTFQKFPKAGGPAEESDTVKDGLSWRVHLLPFLDQAPLYNQFHLNEPWDSEHNKTLIEKMPDVFKTDGVEEPGKTSIHVFIGEAAPFFDNAAPGIREFTDGTSNILLCVIAGPDKADVWTKPGGLEAPADDPLTELGNIGERFQVLFADGSVRFLPSTLDADTLLHLIQHQDGNPVEIPFDEDELQMRRGVDFDFEEAPAEAIPAQPVDE